MVDLDLISSGGEYSIEIEFFCQMLSSRSRSTFFQLQKKERIEAMHKTWGATNKNRILIHDLCHSYLNICVIARNDFRHAVFLLVFAEGPTSDEHGNVLFILFARARVGPTQVPFPRLVRRHDEGWWSVNNGIIKSQKRKSFLPKKGGRTKDSNSSFQPSYFRNFH